MIEMKTKRRTKSTLKPEKLRTRRVCHFLSCFFVTPHSNTFIADLNGTIASVSENQHENTDPVFLSVHNPDSYMVASDMHTGYFEIVTITWCLRNNQNLQTDREMFDFDFVWKTKPNENDRKFASKT